MDRSFLKHAAVYGLGTLLVQAGGFVLLPVYLRCLSPEEYGVLEVVSRVAETLAAILLLAGFRQALFAFHQQAKDDLDRRRVVTGALLLVGGAAVVGGVGYALARPWLRFDSLPGELLTLAVVGILLEPLCLLPLTLIQARVESALYVAVVVGQFLVRVGLCILFVRYLQWGVAGALWATALTGAAFGLTLTGRELLRGVAWPDAKQLGGMVRFALPLVPGGLCYFVLNHGDRFFLLKYATAADVGTYSLGYKLGMIVRLLSLVPLYMVWSSRMYAVAASPDAARAFGRAFTRILAAYVFAGLGVSLFAGEIVTALGGRAYSEAVPVIAPVVVAGLFFSAITLLDAGFYVTRNTGRKLLVTLGGTAVTGLLYALLIPTWGAMGAAIATVGGFLALAAGTYGVTQRLFPVEYEWRRLLGGFGLAAVLWGVGQLLPGSPWALGGKAGLLLAAPLLAWGWLVSADEKTLIRDLVTRLVRRARPRRLASLGIQEGSS